MIQSERIESYWILKPNSPPAILFRGIYSSWNNSFLIICSGFVHELGKLNKFLGKNTNKKKFDA